MSDDELIFENSPNEQDYKIYKLVNTCSQFEFSSPSYTDYNSFDFENDIDPNNNFCDNSTSKCNYYTDSEFNDNMCKLNGLSFIHFNARSLKKNLLKMNYYLQDLHMKFDIVAVSETWAELDVIDDLNLIGYSAYHVTRESRKGGGVALYIRNELSCRLLETKSMEVEHTFECVTVELAIKNHANVIINCMYRTPGSNLDIFCEKIEHMFNDVKAHKTIFLCGDLNIDLLKHEQHSSTKHFLDLMYSLGLYPLIDKPTRVTDISATLIDNIFTNELRHSLTCGILYNDISDHLPIFAVCEYQICRNTKMNTQYTRVINKDTLTSLSHELSLQSWDDILNLHDVNQAYDLFLNKFIGLFSKHCPIKIISRKSDL